MDLDPESERKENIDLNVVTAKEEKENECLKMEVFEDKEYDIEEVKFWNFISKNKGVKPSIIRTVVYKYPESSYVVNKIPVYLPKSERPSECSPRNEESIEKTKTNCSQNEINQQPVS